MAFQTAPIDITYSLLIVLINHLGFIMTFIAVNIRLFSIMAFGAYPICITMVHGKIVSFDLNIAPIIGAVALRALPDPMAIRT